METLIYPWYQLIQDDSLEQGDLFDGCPVFFPPEEIAETLSDAAEFRWEERDIIVMTQTCDLIAGREKVTEVLLFPVWKRSELSEGHLATPRGLEDVRRGSLPGFHMLAECTLGELRREVRIVDFRRIYSLPLVAREVSSARNSGRLVSWD